MIYFDTKKDKKTVEEFLPLVMEFIGLEESLKAARRQPPEDEMVLYYDSRENIARKIPEIIHVSRRAGIPSVIHSYPAPAVGGPVIPVNIFESILQDDSHGQISTQRKIDTINKLIGQVEGKIEFEFRKVINPFFWLGLGIEKVLRIPFWVLSKTGFEISKVEDHFLGKLFKLIEILAILYFSIKLGLPDEWVTTLLRKGG